MTRANPGRFHAHIGIMVTTPNLIEMAILGPKFYRFGLSDPDLVYAGDIYKYVEFFNNLKGFWVFTMIPLWRWIRPGCVLYPYLGPLYTRSQGQCSIQIQHSYWSKSWIQAQGPYTRVKADIEKFFSISPKLLINSEHYGLVIAPRPKRRIPSNLGGRFTTLGANISAFINILTSMF